MEENKCKECGCHKGFLRWVPVRFDLSEFEDDSESD
ncbi:hypothetical protein LCGC14_0441940 [marine sediment metagenome]|uniref:Uncharacterized protein n=1 Tax=marine sediment metagenome TaxID=412755 RepID=A0A0F9SK36_9ZZZZ